MISAAAALLATGGVVGLVVGFALGFMACAWAILPDDYDGGDLPEEAA